MVAERDRTGGLTSDVVFRLTRVVKSYAAGGDTFVSTAALRGVDLDVHEGELLVIMGRSGAGKSTILHLLGGLDSPTSGTIELSVRDKSETVNLHSAPESLKAALRCREIGFVFQAHHLIPTMKVWENVAVPLVFQSMALESRRERSLETLAAVGLEGKAYDYPRALSGGEQQRVALARAISHSPRILLADEPTGNLDRQTTSVIASLLRDIHRSRGMTTVLVTHDPDLADEIGTRIIRMEDGRISGQESKRSVEGRGWS